MAAKIFMPHRPPTHPAVPTPNFAESFFAPARTHLAQAPSARVCPELSDDQWLLLGVRRAWEDRPTGALYFLSREKENMQLAPSGENAWDRAGPRHAGGLADELVATSQGVARRTRSPWSLISP